MGCGRARAGIARVVAADAAKRADPAIDIRLHRFRVTRRIGRTFGTIAAAGRIAF
jgi:hypothetical protein